MATRSNMFRNMENQFEFCSTEEITEKTMDAMNSLVIGLQEREHEKDTIVKLLVIGARIGVASKDGKLNKQENDLFDATFCKLLSGDVESLREMVASGENESDEDIVKALTGYGNDIAMPFLFLILGYAYIDGEVDDEVLGRMDTIFGMNLLGVFFESGLEEVPAPLVRLTDLEAEIVEWMQEDDKLVSLDKPMVDNPPVTEQFPDYTRDELERALDGLCEKGIAYKSDAFVIGEFYALIS